MEYHPLITKFLSRFNIQHFSFAFNCCLLLAVILNHTYEKAHEIKADVSKGIIDHFPGGSSICEIKQWNSAISQPKAYQSNYSPFCLEGDRLDKLKFSALINTMKINPEVKYHLVVTAAHFGTNVNIVYATVPKQVMIQPRLISQDKDVMICEDEDFDSTVIKHSSPKSFVIKFLNETFHEETITVREGLACFFNLYFNKT
jgi:hypothetical protein